MRCHEQGMEAFADASAAALDDMPAAEKATLSPLFPGKAEMDKLLASDADRFQAVAAAVHKGPLDREPLTPVTRRFFQAQAGPVAPAARRRSRGARRFPSSPTPARATWPASPRRTSTPRRCRRWTA